MHHPFSPRDSHHNLFPENTSQPLPLSYSQSCISALSLVNSSLQIILVDFVTMKLSNAFSILDKLRFAISCAILPTLRDVYKNPSILFQPTAFSDRFMLHLWAVYGDGLDEGNKETKRELLSYAHGVVLDIGAGSSRRLILSLLTFWIPG